MPQDQPVNPNDLWRPQETILTTEGAKLVEDVGPLARVLLRDKRFAEGLEKFGYDTIRKEALKLARSMAPRRHLHR